MPRPKILVVSLGGTITMTRGATGGITPTLSAADLVRAVPGIESVAEIEAVSLTSIPGASLSLNNLLELVALIERSAASGRDGVVVIQGTDTIEETAFTPDLLVKNEAPVVVTGAMRGPEAAGADGPANLLAATIVAADPRAGRLGTLVVLNDEVHAARFVQKSHTALPSAFSSPIAGPVGLVAEGQALFHVLLTRRKSLAWDTQSVDRPVALIGMALGDDGRIMPSLSALGFRGAVLAAMGAGHVPASVAALVRDLVSAMPVVLATRVQNGPVFSNTYGFPGSERDLLAAGVQSAGFLSPLKARLLLMLILRQVTERPQIEDAFRAYISS
jgi:L-asparaginase